MQLKPEDMMADHTVDQGKDTAGSIPKEILDCFWGIAELDDEMRHQSSVKLLNILSSKKEENDESSFEDLQKYVLKRLITGLSSNRQAASLGFATALCEVLKLLKSDLVLRELLITISEYLKTSKQDNRAHQTHIGLGKILAYTSIIRSGLIHEATQNDLEIIIRAVVRVRNKHVMLSTVTMECLTQLCMSADATKLSAAMQSEMNAELTGGWENCTADTLQLLLVLQEQKIFRDDFFAECWEAGKILSSHTLNYLSKILQSSTTIHPIIHPVNLAVSTRLLVSGPKIFAKYWKSVALGEVFSTEKPKRCYMIYHIIPELLKHNNISQKTVSTILCPELVGAMMKHISHKDTFLHKAALKLAADIVEITKNMADGMQSQVLQCLLSEPGSYLFDSVTSSRTVSSIILNLKKDACMKFSKQLMDAVTGQDDLYGQSGEGVVSWCSLTLTHMLTSQSIGASSEGDNWQTDILSFLLLHSCFNMTKPHPELKHCEKVVTLSETNRRSIKDALLKGLSLLSTFQPTVNKTDGKSGADFDYNDIMDHIYGYLSKLMEQADDIQSIRVFSEKEVSAWIGASLTCKTIKKHIKDSGNDKGKQEMCQAFQLMLQLFGLHLHIVEEAELQEVVDTIQDGEMMRLIDKLDSWCKKAETALELQACFKKSVSRTRAKEEGPEWSEVITEMLISLMSKSSHLLRAVSSNVFAKILPLCNITSIQLILEVFMTDDGDLEDENDAGEPLEDCCLKYDKDQEEIDGESSSSEEEDESEEEDDEEVDENMRATIQAALGPAAVTSDQSDQEGADDMSDSEMFKLDDALAAAFRAMRKKSKKSPDALEKKRQVTHFKLRCMDLIEVVVKNSNRGEHLMELIVPLLTLIEAGYKEFIMKDVGNKAQNIYNHLLALKKLPVCSFTDEESITEKVDAVLALSTNANVWPIMKEISGALNFMIKLLSHSELTDLTAKKNKKTEAKLEHLVTDAVKAALSDFFIRRESKYSHTLFQKLFERQPTLFWSYADTLLDFIGNTDVRVFCRTQGCALVMPLLHKNVINEVGQETWADYQSKLSKAIKLIAAYSSENIKQGFLTEFFSLLCRSRNIDKTMVIDVSAFDGISGKFSKDLMRMYKRVKSSTEVKSAPPATKKKRKTSISAALEENPTSAETKINRNKKSKIR